MAWDNIALTDGTTSVTINTTSVKRILVNQLFSYALPIPRGSWSTKDAETRIMDMRRVTLKFEVRGIIKDVSGGDNHVTQAVKLLTLAGAGKSDRIVGSRAAQSGSTRRGGTIQMSWGSSTDAEAYDVCIDKMEISEDAKLYGGDRFHVMFTAIAGEDR